jgi:protein involved in polysaccharide export with SLBB domain
MRYGSFLLVVLLFFSFPLRGQAAESSGAGAASSSSKGSPASSSFSAPASLTGPASITNAPPDAGKPAPDNGNRTEERDAVAPSGISATTGSFQSYVASSTGASLGMFGRELFGNVPSTYAPLGGAQVNADYVIGPGDALQIRGWGMVDIDLNVTVNRSGEIYLPRVGSVNVAGVKYRDLQGHLKKAISRIYTNFELTATIAQTRSVQIYILGHAQRPGTYTLSAMSALLNALFASGGPSATGTMRDIQLKRGTAAPVSIDLYEMLLHGDKSMDQSLQDGDVIYIPEVGPLVALFGNVKRASIFELNKKTSLSEVVNWAGGFESAADLKQVIIEKSVDNRYQTIAELQADKVSITKELSTIVMRPTDIIRVFAPGTIPFQVKVARAFVLVDGAVKQPGVFQIEKDETLKGLVARSGGANEKGFVYGTVFTRESVRREQQTKIDQTVDRFEKDLDANYRERLARESDPEKVAMIQKQIEFQRGLISKLRDFKADGRIILGLNEFESNITELPDFPLEDGDRILIPEKSTTVSVLGSVYQQNTFIYKPDYSVNDYIEKAGGVNPSADKSMVYRICADGSLQSKKHGGWSGSINPGDAIVVPEKIVKVGGFGTNLTTFLKDWTTILYQFGLGAAGLKTLNN